MKHADFIRQTLAGAKQYFVRTVNIGKNDLAAIRKASDFTPDDPDVQFYLGQGDGGATVGVVLFQQVDTPHGPIEVGLTFGPTGRSPARWSPRRRWRPSPGCRRRSPPGSWTTSPACARATIRGRRFGASTAKLGGMPEYMAELIATAVGRGLVLYSTLYKESAT